jgi:ribose/xylose/arabinose/galactoside ABC-type transport system permease subunit
VGPTKATVGPAGDTASSTPTGSAPSAEGPERSSRTSPARRRARTLFPVARVGVVVAFVVLVAVFWMLRPAVFSDWHTWRGILDASAIPAVIAMTLTVTLIVGDFDLSIGATVGLAMAVTVVLLAEHHVSWPLAGLAAILVAVAVGLVNGALITWARVNSFIGTLAVSSVVAGLDAKVSGQKTITTGIPTSFINLGLNRYLGIGIPLWVAIALGAALYLLVGHTESGRYLYAVGGNREAARLAGVRVRSLRTVGMVSAALGAALAGFLLAAQTASYYPNAGTGYLLPAYAAAFLGTALGGGRFGILATAFGVLFLQTLQTGLTVINVQPWIVLVVQGLVLATAVMVSTVGTIQIPGLRRRRGLRKATA